MIWRGHNEEKDLIVHEGCVGSNRAVEGGNKGCLLNPSDLYCRFCERVKLR